MIYQIDLIVFLMIICLLSDYLFFRLEFCIYSIARKGMAFSAGKLERLVNLVATTTLPRTGWRFQQGSWSVDQLDRHQGRGLSC